MDFLNSVNKKIEENKAEMISSLSKLLSIPSVVSEKKGDMPFGENVHKAYRFVMDMAEAEGFDTFNADNFGGHVDFAVTSGKGPSQEATSGKKHADGEDGEPPAKGGPVAVVGHLDVVPEGTGWDFDPYGGEVIDGNICGRGATDDKGPVIASFYAMKALKECGYQPRRTIRLILGLDEETNWNGMRYYLSRVEEEPEFGFTPDGDFPAIHGEMGILVFDIAKKFAAFGGKGLELSSVKGGNAPNSVADHARAVLHDSAGGGYEHIKEKVATFRAEKSCKINCKGVGKSFEITIQGVSAHGAKPEQGKNAVSMMMEFLGKLNFANDDTNDFISFYNDCIGYDLHGERMGCEFSDEPSGKLIFNVGMIEQDKKTAKLTINIRYPVTMDDEAVYRGVMSVLDRYNLGVVKGKHQLPIYIPEDDPFICTLMDVYRRHTQDMESRPLVIGGGTYARAVKNTVAFGARFPQDPDVMHQKNESISINNMMQLARIYAETIYRLAEME